MNNPIPLVDLRANYEPLKDEIRQAWDEVLSGMRLFLGPNVQAFEREFADYCGVAHAIGVSDGTNALHLALRACGVGPGDEVITVSHTFNATAEAILLAGAKPVFVDIDEETLCMDPKDLKKKITKKSKAIIPVHYGGHPAELDTIHDIAAALGLVQLKKIEKMNRKRKALTERYDQKLKKYKWLTTPQVRPWAKSAYHNYVIRTKLRDRLNLFLKARKISSGVHYFPVHMFSYYKKNNYHANVPVTEAVWKELLTLPLYPTLSISDQNRVITSIEEFHKELTTRKQ